MRADRAGAREAPSQPTPAIGTTRQRRLVSQRRRRRRWWCRDCPCERPSECLQRGLAADGLLSPRADCQRTKAPATECRSGHLLTTGIHKSGERLVERGTDLQ